MAVDDIIVKDSLFVVEGSNCRSGEVHDTKLVFVGSTGGGGIVGGPIMVPDVGNHGSVDCGTGEVGVKFESGGTCGGHGGVMVPLFLHEIYRGRGLGCA